MSHPPIQTAVILAADLVDKTGDKAEIGRRAKEQLNRAHGQVVDVRPRPDGSGKVIAYEVDIR